MSAGSWGLRIARSPVGGTMAWLALGPLRRGVPVRLVAEGREVRAYRHPRPSYPFHVLIVPKHRVADYLDATASLLADVLDLTAEVTRARGESAVDLVTNLGQYREVKLLHFHVIPAVEEIPGNVSSDPVEELFAATTSAARAALASVGKARVVISPTNSGSVRWRVA